MGVSGAPDEHADGEADADDEDAEGREHRQHPPLSAGALDAVVLLEDGEGVGEGTAVEVAEEGLCDGRVCGDNT